VHLFANVLLASLVQQTKTASLAFYNFQFKNNFDNYGFDCADIAAVYFPSINSNDENLKLICCFETSVKFLANESSKRGFKPLF